MSTKFRTDKKLRMKAKIPFFFFLIFLIVGLSYCIQPPDYPSEPVITFKSLNKNVIEQGSATAIFDTLVVTISYTDGDGDLGYEDPAFDIILTDSRDGNINQFRLPVIPEQGTGNGISGEIQLFIPNAPSNLCCIPEIGDPCTVIAGLSEDTFSYSIYIIDRAGHQSNTVETDPITLLCK